MNKLDQGLDEQLQRVKNELTLFSSFQVDEPEVLEKDVEELKKKTNATKTNVCRLTVAVLVRFNNNITIN